MTEQELHDYLKQHLKIEIKHIYPYGMLHRLRRRLLLDGETIDESIVKAK